MIVVTPPAIEREQRNSNDRNDHDRNDDDGLRLDARCSVSGARRLPTSWPSCIITDPALVFPIMLIAKIRFGIRRILTIFPRGR